MAGASAMEVRSETVLLACCPQDARTLNAAFAGACRVKLADDGDEALRIVRRGSVAAVVCDPVSPACRALLGRPHDEGALDVPVLALVQEGDDDAQAAALEQGFDDVVCLPSSPRLARARLRHALRCHSRSLRARDGQRAAEERAREISDQLGFLNEISRYLLVGTDPSEAIRLALKKTMEHFCGDRSYVFELDDELRESANTYEVCAPGIASKQPDLQHLPYDRQSYILAEFRDDRIVCFDDVSRMPKEGVEEQCILEQQGVGNVFLVPLWREGKLVGYTGVDNPRKNTHHAGELVAIGDYLAAMLVRRDHTLRMENDNEVMQRLMNDTPGGFVRLKMLPGGHAVPVFVNDGFCQLMGMTHDEAMALYTKDAYAGVHPDDVPELMQTAARAMEESAMFSARARFLHKEKGYVSFQAFYRTTDEPDGTQCMNAYYADMTAEAEQEERRRELLDNLPCGAIILEIGEDGTIDSSHINKRYMELVGRTGDQLCIHDSILGIHPDDRERLMRTIDEAIRGNREMECDIRSLKDDGDYVAFHLVGNIVEKEAHKTVMYTTYTPISEETRSLSVALADQRRAEQQAREINDQLSFLNEASRYLLVGSDPNDSIHLALEKMREYFGGDRAYVFELDEKRQESNNTYETCAPEAVSEKGSLQHVPFALQEYALGILRKGESIFLDDSRGIADSGIDASRIITSQGIHRLVLVPLRSGTELVGFMGVDNPTRNASHVSHLVALGDYMTAILHRRDNEDQILHDNRVMHDIMNDMPGGFVQQRVYPDGRTVPLFINAEFCRMSGMSHDECFEFYGADGFTGVHPDDNDMAKRALEKLVTARETITLRLRLIRGDGSYVPMQVFYRVTDDRDGNLLLSGYYTDLTEELAAKERAMAERDELTGLFNRTRLARMRAGAYQGLSSCGVLFFDVNHLKAVNDTQGHDRGDVLLKLVADGIRAITDERIHGYRYGGDEFLVVACDGDEAELAQLVERWRGHLGVLAEVRDVVATAAVGSCWGEAPFTLNDLIHRADEAMYADKQRVRGWEG